MSQRVTITYRGPAPFASALAQALEREGVSVTYTPPPEERSAAGTIAGAIMLNLVCNGGYDAIKAGVRHFRESRLGTATTVEVPDEEDRNGRAP